MFALSPFRLAGILWLVCVCGLADGGVALTAPKQDAPIPTGATDTKAQRKEREKRRAKLEAARAAAQAAKNPFESGKPFVAKGEIDRLVARDLAAHGLKPSPECSDAVFLRRAYLDITGTIPDAAQARAFIADNTPDKRARLIDRLLASPEHAAYWALKWGDLLRIKAEFPINLWPNAAQAYTRYVEASVRDNKPLDVFARELLTAQGSNFRVPQANFFRAIQGRTKEAIAASAALVFLGARADKMPPEYLAAIANFFSRVAYKSTDEWKEEIVYCDPRLRGALKVRYPDYTEGVVPDGKDPRAAFADWLTAPDNPFFAKVQVNRMWYWIFGIALFDSTDNLNPKSVAANPELARYLAERFVKLGYDTRAWLREVLSSSVYGQSSLADTDNAERFRRFGAYPVRQLEAEPLIDAVCKVTGTTEVYTSTTPEPYTTLPTCEEAVDIPDGSITTAFLELFGRSPRDTGLDAERERKPSASQRVHLLNASHIRNKIQSGAIPRAPKKGEPYPVFLENVFLRTLSRFPTPDERALMRERDPDNPKAARYTLADLYWALLNSEEFLTRH